MTAKTDFTHLQKQIEVYDRITQKEKKEVSKENTNLFDLLRLGIIENMIISNFVSRQLKTITEGNISLDDKISILKAQIMTMPIYSNYNIIERKAFIETLEVLEVFRDEYLTKK